MMAKNVIIPKPKHTQNRPDEILDMSKGLKTYRKKVTNSPIEIALRN